MSRPHAEFIPVELVFAGQPVTGETLGPRPKLVLTGPPSNFIWCDQCDRRVPREAGNACLAPYCKGKSG